MTKILKSTAFKIVAISLGAVLLLSGALVWYIAQPKFHDLTVELGQSMPTVADFKTQWAISGLSKQVTAPEDVPIRQVGTHDVTLRYCFWDYTVKLTVQDTTAPEVKFQDVTAYIDEVPKAEDFVLEAKDESKLSITLGSELTKPETYGNAQVEVTVTDAQGNKVSKVCTVHYVWMEREYTLELGDKLTKEDLLLRPEKDADLLGQAVIDQINGSPIGSYTITSVDGDLECMCTVQVVDTTSPVLELNAITIYLSEEVTKEDFIKSATDISGPVTVNLTTAPDVNKEGKQTITFEAVDGSGNKTTVQTTLTVLKDSVGPVFSGVKEMKVEKSATPNFTKGVKAVDARDGQVEFKVDTSKVRLDTAGTYYAIYTATDSLGNTTTYRRRIVVGYDEEDVAKLVSQIAAKLPDNDALALRDYMRALKYSHDWGGPDPTKGQPDPAYTYVWFGFKNKHGNCYVHALGLEALLKEKGFETQLVWATDKSHYWNMVKIDGKWYHIDSTPGTRHTVYDLMNDAQRYETLWHPDKKYQRDWDRSLWPACP